MTLQMQVGCTFIMHACACMISTVQYIYTYIFMYVYIYLFRIHMMYVHISMRQMYMCSACMPVYYIDG